MMMGWIPLNGHSDEAFKVFVHWPHVDKIPQTVTKDMGSGTGVSLIKHSLETWLLFDTLELPEQ